MRPSTEPRPPERGEVWLVNFNPGRDSEQRGIRPALVVQNDTGNRFAGTTIVATITTTTRPYPATVVVRGHTCGLAQESMVNLAQVVTIDKLRLMRRRGRLEPELQAADDQALRVSLGLT